VPALAKALKDEMYTVRLSAAEALGHIGPEAQAAIPELKAALKDKSDDVSSAAEDALNSISGKGEK
jgi:HEAT repeat protein